MFGVGSITIRELLRLPAAAVHRLGADVLHVETVDHFGTVFIDASVHQALFVAAFVQVVADQEASNTSHHSHRDGHQQVLFGYP